ncbi:MAG TPA: hypothetical protein VF092_23005 [Longimicrobium sp.]
MGSSYSNIILRGPERGRVIEALEARGRSAYVGPATDGAVVVFDRQSEDDPNLGSALAAELNRELGGVALLATVYDEDIFLFRLFRDGQVADEYDSNPGYFDGEALEPAGGDAAKLVEAFGGGDAAAVERILRAPANSGDYTFETARHQDFARALRLPAHSVGLGYGYVQQGDAEELQTQMTHVGPTEEEEDGGGGGMADPFAFLRDSLGQSPGGAAALAQLDAMSALGQTPAHGYFQALLEGDASAVRDLFGGMPVIDDPLSGKVDGASLEAHVTAAHALFAGGMAQYVASATVETPERVVAQGMVSVQGAMGMQVLPAACVWERSADGRFRALRAYWAPGGLRGMRGEREPILEPQPEMALPEPIGRHLQALAADDLDALRQTYDDACLVPIPIPWVTAEDTIRRQYGARIGEEGSIVLIPCLLTDDGTTCAVEYVTTRWDGADVQPQAGLAVYQRRGGKICEVQVYGDFAPAPEAGLPGGLPFSSEGMQQVMQQMMQGGGADLFGGLGGLGDLGGMQSLEGLGDLGQMGDLDEMMKQLQGMLGGGMPDLSGGAASEGEEKKEGDGDGGAGESPKP